MAANTMGIMKMLFNAFDFNFKLDIAVWNDYYCTSKLRDVSSIVLLPKITSARAHTFGLLLVSKRNGFNWIYRKVVMSIFMDALFNVLCYHILQNGAKLDNFFHLIFTLNTHAIKWAVESDTVELFCIIVHSQLVVILFIALLVWWLSFIIYSTVEYTLKTEKLIWQKQIKNKNKNNKNLVENTSYTWKKTEQLHASPNFDRSLSCIS